MDRITLCQKLRGDFFVNIRPNRIENKCLCGATEDLVLHHVDTFSDLLDETLEMLKIDLFCNEFTYEQYKIIKYIMRGKQLTSKVITLCPICHSEAHEEGSIYARKKYWEAKNKGDKSRIKLGKFHTIYYNDLLALDIEPQYILRFIYLCTYADYDNVIKLGKNRKHLAKQKDLADIWNLSKNETLGTKKALIEYDLLIINEDGTLSINKKYACQDKMNKFKNKKEYVKIYDDGIRDLYEKAEPIKHKKLSVLIRMLPYIHLDINIICHNPSELNKSTIKPMTVTELCEVMGYNKTQSSRLKKDLMSFKVNGYNVITILVVNNKHTISVNPRVYYKGNKIDELNTLINEFDILEEV